MTIAVCDAIRLDPNTLRKTPVGVYAHVVAESFPHAMPPVWIYVPFTGAQGMLTLGVRILDGQTVPFEAGARATCGDPAANHEMTVPGRGLVIPWPGVSVIEALAGGVAFARRELRVVAKATAAYPAALAPSAS